VTKKVVGVFVRFSCAASKVLSEAISPNIVTYDD
jgi:hypothetical protein